MLNKYYSYTVNMQSLLMLMDGVALPSCRGKFLVSTICFFALATVMSIKTMIQHNIYERSTKLTVEISIAGHSIIILSLLTNIFNETTRLKMIS